MTLEQAIHDLVGIPPEEQPADCYRLLGLARSEAGLQVIRSAATQREATVRDRLGEEHTAHADAVLDLIDGARRELLDPRRRLLYSGRLSSVAPSSATVNGGAGNAAATSDGQVADRPRRAPQGPPRRALVPMTADDTRLDMEDTCQAGDSVVSREWIIGSAADCDIIVNAPGVSRCHCRMWEIEGLFWIEDLGSRNGTLVNNRRITGRQLVGPDDEITLGGTARVPWPGDGAHHDPAAHRGEQPLALKTITVGRSRSNDVVLSDPSVSRRHVQVSVFEDHVVLEDLGSTNGTFVGESAMRVTRRVVLPAEIVTIGRFHLTVDDLRQMNKRE